RRLPLHLAKNMQRRMPQGVTRTSRLTCAGTRRYRAPAILAPEELDATPRQPNPRPDRRDRAPLGERRGDRRLLGRVLHEWCRPFHGRGMLPGLRARLSPG